MQPAFPRLVALLALLVPAASLAQIAHQGPAANIARAQALTPYDVASVKQNVTGDDHGNMNIDDHGLFTVTNLPLDWIIEFAYDIKADQIAGLSGPIPNARFDIVAKILPPAAGPPPEQPDSDMQARIILLLQDRFHLKAHLESRTRPVYDLVVAKGGPKLTLAQDEIKNSSWNINGESNLKVLVGKTTRMSDLAAVLGDQVHRKVIDKTGLAGHADMTLKWSDDVAVEQSDPNLISIFTALEEQLGLKLVSSKGPVDTLVIDHVEMPAAN